MMDLAPGVTPALILSLYEKNNNPGKRLQELLRRTFVESEVSRRHCSHLVHLFDDPSAAVVRHVDVYVAHSRWMGGQAWGQLRISLSEGLGQITRSAQRESPDHRWGLVEVICEESRRLASEDRDLALQLGHLALALAESTPLGPLPESARRELLALAHATIANALRAMDLALEANGEAEEALGYLNQAEESPLRLAPFILSLKASVDIATRRYSEALLTLGAALDACQGHQPQLRSRLLIKRASVFIYGRQHGEALYDLQRAASILDPVQDPVLWCCAKQYHLFIATEAGQWEKADLLVTEVEGQLREFGTEVHLIKLGWCKARLELNKGHFGEAESQYLKAREDFLHHQLAYNAALVTVELAQLLLEQGRLEEVKHYALETAAEFERQGVEPELIGAIALLERAVLAQRLTVQLLARIQRQLQRYEGASRR